ncbi:MAG: YdaS family helix-turn-helix protein [Sphingomonas sp.]|jgi:DNA-binding transcriptional regulator YdaS (Cro superfamily)|uniref:transcriptional regulator n=1 Tax=Sphingomonas sp. TaxID=28214 RepID=UPI00356993F5
MDQLPTPFEALQEAVRIVGGQSALGRLCKKAQPTVWKWLQSSKRLPAEQVLTVEAATGISRHLLRPDIYPEEPSYVGLTGDHDARVTGGAPIVPCDRRALLQRDAA